MATFVDSTMQMFIMTLGAFGGTWEELPNTAHETVGKKSLFMTSKYLTKGKIHWFLFIALLVILLLNLLIAMMG